VKSWLSTKGSLLQCLLIATCLLLFSGCSTVRVFPEDLPPIPASLLQECREPMVLKDGRPGTVAQVLLQDAEDLHQCRDRHKALVEVLKFRERLYDSHKE
jgi:hypothetical protein